tara:strand:- start:753 stop:1376 length:624 start_codon:yes stop_codon:yes gene_type:complete
MLLSIKHQESYSRSELLLRAFFGLFYIFIPHLFLLLFCAIWGSILRFIAWWVILFTGRHPESFFEYQVNLLRWNLRLQARILNLSDGYPAFGLSGTDDNTTLEVPYPEKLSRGTHLLKTLFGAIYVILPHVFILYFRAIWGMILNFLSFWSVLFTGSYPKSWHEFQVGTIRWSTRVNLYMGYMSDEYPPFSSKPDVEDEKIESASTE